VAAGHAAASRQHSVDQPGSSGGRQAGSAGGSGRSLEFTVTAPTGPPAFSAPRGATITTGLNRPSAPAAAPVASGTPRGSGSAGGAPPMVSAFAAASSLPTLPPGPQAARSGAGKGAPRPVVSAVRAESSPATITTGITATQPAAAAPRPSVSGCGSRCAAACAGLLFFGRLNRGGRQPLATHKPFVHPRPALPLLPCRVPWQACPRWVWMCYLEQPACSSLPPMT
jgi:hypothetical protein